MTYNIGNIRKEQRQKGDGSGHTAYRKSVISTNPISDRTLEVRLDTTPVPTTIIQVYAPTNSSNQGNPQLTEDSCEQLQDVTESHKERYSSSWGTSMPKQGLELMGTLTTSF